MLTLPLVFLATACGGAHALPSAPRAAATLSLPLVGELNLARLANVVQADRARAAWLMQRTQQQQHARRQSATVAATNTAVDFTVQVGIGEPATQYTLLLDTGSANTWIGANKSFTPTAASHNTGKSFHVQYGSGEVSGTEYTDKLDLGNGLVINDQSIGVANSTSQFDGSFDGILGIGPTDLTKGTVSGTPGTVATVVDSLHAQGKIGAKVLGMFYPPYAARAAGAVTFGGADAARCTGPLGYAPVTATQPAGDYFGVEQTLAYGGTAISGARAVAGIVDSGTTLVLLASDHFAAYKNATGATEDKNTGMLALTKEQFANLKPLHFHIGDKTWTLNANAQIWPRSLNAALGGDDAHVYLVVGDLGASSGAGLDFINGYTFMQRFYTVFDASNSRVGFATTKYTDSEAN